LNFFLLLLFLHCLIQLFVLAQGWNYRNFKFN